MKRSLWALAVVAVVVIAGSVAAAEKGKVRVLLTVGGHGYEEQPFYDVFRSMPDVEFQIAQMPKDAGMLAPDFTSRFDVLVMYDMVGGISPEQQKAFVELLQKGIGVVAMHHNMGAHPSWHEYAKIIGGKFFLEDTQFAGAKHKQSGWDHDQELKISVADKDHPITKGVGDFTILDEVYNRYWTDPKAKVLLTTDHPKNDREIGWVTEYGKSRVFYLMLGHDSKAYANPSYRKIVRQGILWAAKR